jgi:hypothetical protein
MDIFLIRNDVTRDAVRGVLVVGDRMFQTLERPWANNQSNISCVPAGIYETRYFPKSSSGKYKKVYWLQDVPGRFGVLIHAGNIPAHTKGCILIGKRRGVLAGGPAVLNSRTALGEFRELVGRESFHLNIIGGQVWNS